MSREHKFRQLFQHEKYQDRKRWKYYDIESAVSGMYSDPLEDWRENPISPYLEFTGLKDKNGKEIYEDDIVKISGNDPMIAKIDWMEVDAFEVYGCNVWTFLGAYDREYKLGTNIQESVEVIGNIYENPELLNQQ